MRYPTKASNGHFTATFGNKNYILDTGCPISVSFGGEREVEIEGQVFPLANAFSSARKEISKLTGMEVEGLIGMDAFTALKTMTINKRDGYVEFGKTETEGADFYPFHSFRGQYITMDISVNGKNVGVILDTGARIDYMDPSLLDDRVVRSSEKDYNPFLGYFETDGHDSVYRLGEREMKTVTYGATDILADYVEGLRRATGISGVIGINAFFQTSPTVTLDFLRNLLVLER
ncbi:MAG: hypothetical protein ACI4S4_01885 [Candidatus Ornithospirochaeta sp.]